jgi:hypothetical protein
MSTEIQLPEGIVEPRGRRITSVVLRGSGTQLVVEDYESFCERFSAFMEREHSRGDLFTFTTVYRWQQDNANMTHIHSKFEPGAWTLDGCQDVEAINVHYLETEPIEIKQPSQLMAPPPIILHGPGKRAR